MSPAASLTKRIIITHDAQTEITPELQQIETANLKRVLDLLHARQQSDMLQDAGPAGAFMLEPTSGFWQYIANYVRRTRGIISLQASLSRQDTTETLLVDLFEYELALAEWEVLIENEYEVQVQQVQGLGAELAWTKKLLTQVTPHE